MPVSDKPALLPHSTDCIDEFSTMTGSWILAHLHSYMQKPEAVFYHGAESHMQFPP